MTRTLLRRGALPAAILSVLGGATIAFAEPDRTFTMSAAKPTADWDGGPISGAIVVNDSFEETLVKLNEPGDLKASISDVSDASGTVDLDLYLFKSNAAGEEDGDPLVESESEGNDEMVSKKGLAPGYYLIQVTAFTAVEATFKGHAVFTSAGGGTPDPSATPGATPTPAPGPGGSQDATPDATIAAVKKSYRSRKLKGFKGTASDDKAVSKVEVAIVRKKGGKCFALTSRGTNARIAKCDAPNVWLDATGTASWSLKLPKKLKKGSYTIFARATDNAGQRQAGFTAANKKTFKVKK